MNRLRYLLPAAVLLLNLTSCWPRKKRAPTPPPTPMPQSRPAETPKVVTPPPPKVQVPAPPPSEQSVPPAVKAESPPTIETPPPPQPATKKIRPPQRRPQPPAEPADPAAEQTPAAPPPQLGEIFSDEQRQRYTRVLDRSLGEVRKALSTLSSRKLNTEQTETVNRIRTFASQAEESRGKDLVTAVNLAQRAQLLAQDLLSQLQ